MSKKPIMPPFSGRLSDDIRHRFALKRRELGVTYMRLSDVFGIHWSTIRKWEMGPTSFCSITNCQLILDFINGVYDAQIQASKTLSPKHYRPYYNLSERDPLQQVMERTISSYHLCELSPPYTKKLTKRINSVIDSTLVEMMAEENERLAAEGHFVFLPVNPIDEPSANTPENMQLPPMADDEDSIPMAEDEQMPPMADDEELIPMAEDEQMPPEVKAEEPPSEAEDKLPSMAENEEMTPEAEDEEPPLMAEDEQMPPEIKAEEPPATD